MKETTKEINLKNWLLDRRRTLVFMPRLHLDTKQWEFSIESYKAERKSFPSLIGLLPQAGLFRESWAGEQRSPVLTPPSSLSFLRALFEVTAISTSQRTSAISQRDLQQGVYLELELEKERRRLPKNGRIVIQGDKRFIGLSAGIPWPPTPGKELSKLWIIQLEEDARQDLTVRLNVQPGSDNIVENGGIRVTYRISGPFDLPSEINRLASGSATREATASMIATVFGEEAIDPLLKEITYRDEAKDLGIFTALSKVACRSDSKLARSVYDRLQWDPQLYDDRRVSGLAREVASKPTCK